MLNFNRIVSERAELIHWDIDFPIVLYSLASKSNFYIVSFLCKDFEAYYELLKFKVNIE